jgi:hypothetical protein
MSKLAVIDREAVNRQLVWLQEEIAVLERRLDAMGLDGDCAYERAISKVYIDLVADRKQQLAALALPAGN